MQNVCSQILSTAAHKQDEVSQKSSSGGAFSAITDAIRMVLDEDGFYYPCVNEDLCVKCMQCTRVCVIKVQQTGEVT